MNIHNSVCFAMFIGAKISRASRTGIKSGMNRNHPAQCGTFKFRQRTETFKIFCKTFYTFSYARRET